MDISGDSAYFANHLDGLQILDIETPELTSIISDVDIDYYALDVAVSDGYAYVVNGHTFVVDIDPVESASIVQMVETYTAECIHISGNYAYTAGWSDGVQIINISSPESAYIVNTLGSHSEDVSVDGDCAYIAESNMMRIFNVNPPETAYWVNSVDASGARRVYASGGYAFVGSGSPNGMYIFDVDPLETAHLIKTVETDSSVESMYVSDGYAFIITSWADFQIIDVVPPENAHIVETISTYGGISDVKISGDYAFVAGEYGSKIIRLR